MRVLFAGGGTGGHIYPIQAVSKALKKISAEYSMSLQMYYLGGIDIYSSVLKDEGIKMHGMLTGKLRRYFSLMNLVDVPKFFIGCIQATAKVFFIMPDVIFSKGGPGALPVVFAGWFYHIPIVVHESDAVPGLTTLLSSKFAKRICVSFEVVTKYFNPKKVVLTGNPIRPEFFEPWDQNFSKLELGFKEDKPLLVILGGSQGSKRLNEYVMAILGEILKSAQILHQTGLANFEETQKLSKATLLDTPLQAELEHRYSIVPYLDSKKMRSALAAADVVLSRAGSSSISEIAAFHKAALLVPLKGSANDHQRQNAYALADQGAALVIEETNLNSTILLNQLKTLFTSPDACATLGKNIAKFARPEAAEQIAGEIVVLGS